MKFQNKCNRITAYNSSYPKVAVQWSNQVRCFYQRLYLVGSEVLRNRHLRVAAKRYKQAEEKRQLQNDNEIFAA